MTSPIELVLPRLEPFKLRANGPGRWRSCCPAHGGSNASALSVGVGNDDAVLMKCWQGCSVGEVAGALGLDLQDLFSSKLRGSGPIHRRRLLTASQALELLDQEMGLAIVCAVDMANGEALNESTRDRLRKCAARLTLLRDEVRA